MSFTFIAKYAGYFLFGVKVRPINLERLNELNFVLFPRTPKLVKNRRIGFVALVFEKLQVMDAVHLLQFTYRQKGPTNRAAGLEQLEQQQRMHLLKEPNVLWNQNRATGFPMALHVAATARMARIKPEKRDEIGDSLYLDSFSTPLGLESFSWCSPEAAPPRGSTPSVLASNTMTST